MPPPIVNGTNTSSAVRRASCNDRVALLVRGGDVEEHELVGPLAVVVRGQLDGVAGVADVDEFDALDDAAVVHVEAGDHALEVHASHRSGATRGAPLRGPPGRPGGGPIQIFIPRGPRARRPP